jgi:hypothetical protein
VLGHETAGPPASGNFEDDAMIALPPPIEALAVTITKAIGSEPAKVFRSALEVATDDDSPEDCACVAVVAWLLAQPRPARDRVDHIAVLIKLARPA